MLQSYEAELRGNQLVWLGNSPPTQTAPRRIVVVLDDAANDDSNEISQNRRLKVAQILQQAKGVLGNASRESVLRDLEQSRADWEQ